MEVWLQFAPKASGMIFSTVSNRRISKRAARDHNYILYRCYSQTIILKLKMHYFSFAIIFTKKNDYHPRDNTYIVHRCHSQTIWFKSKLKMRKSIVRIVFKILIQINWQSPVRQNLHRCSNPFAKTFVSTFAKKKRKPISQNTLKIFVHNTRATTALLARGLVSASPPSRLR